MRNVPEPWVTPRVSPELNVLMRNLGHKSLCPKGEEVSLYSRGRMLENLVFVQSGMIEVEVVIPGYEDIPFFVSLALSGSLLGSLESLSVKDSSVCRYRALTNCELLTVPRDLLLRLADHDVSWYKKITEYSALCTGSDRLGLIVTRACEPPNRFGIFLYAFYSRSGSSTVDDIYDDSKEWIAISSLPPMPLVAQVIGCDTATVEDIVKSWVAEGVLRRNHRSYIVRRKKLLEHKEWLGRFDRGA